MDKLNSKAATSLFLNGTYSTPKFYGVIYASNLTKYVSIGFVEKFTGTKLVPTTLKAFVDNVSISGFNFLLAKEKIITRLRALRICINILDQLQKVIKDDIYSYL